MPKTLFEHVEPRRDVLDGVLSDSVFAASLDEVVAGRRTFPSTPDLADVISSRNHHVRIPASPPGRRSRWSRQCAPTTLAALPCAPSRREGTRSDEFRRWGPALVEHPRGGRNPQRREKLSVRLDPSARDSDRQDRQSTIDPRHGSGALGRRANSDLARSDRVRLPGGRHANWEVATRGCGSVFLKEGNHRDLGHILSVSLARCARSVGQPRAP
jgi:hypothetical protein